MIKKKQIGAGLAALPDALWRRWGPLAAVTGKKHAFIRAPSFMEFFFK
jgi:hypothetical protein